jgi:hypothetical protein
MQSVGIWHVTEAGPQKLKTSAINLELQLEDWIERNPDLLEAGLTIVGRQTKVDSGPIDLLALDAQGRWCVIELKRSTLYRDALAQALDYAACIATLPQSQLSEKVDAYFAKSGQSLATLQGGQAASVDDDESERDVRVFLVGTGRDPGLERVVSYLAGRFNVPIDMVSFGVFELAGGEQVLVRELSEAESPVSGGSWKPSTIEEICLHADEAGIGPQFRAIHDAATKHGLYPRAAKYCIWYTPPANRNRALFTVWSDPPAPGEVSVWLGSETMAQFYPMLTEELITQELGKPEWRRLSSEDVDAFCQGLHRLFARVEDALDTGHVAS